MTISNFCLTAGCNGCAGRSSLPAIRRIERGQQRTRGRRHRLRQGLRFLEQQSEGQGGTSQARCRSFDVAFSEIETYSADRTHDGRRAAVR